MKNKYDNYKDDDVYAAEIDIRFFADSKEHAREIFIEWATYIFEQEEVLQIHGDVIDER